MKVKNGAVAFILVSLSPLPSTAFIHPIVAVQAKIPPFYVSSLNSVHSSNGALEPRFQIKGNNGDYSAVTQEIAILRKALDDKEVAFSAATGALESNQNELLVKISDLVAALNEAQNVMSLAESKLSKTKKELADAQSRITDLESALDHKDAELVEIREELKQNSGGEVFVGSTSETEEFQIPDLNDWYLESDGAIMGIVSNHPGIEDGTTILTSPLENTSSVIEHGIITTSSGSKYRLGKPVAYQDSSELSGDIFCGDGKYILVGKPKNSAAGRSQIWSAVRSDSGNTLDEDAPLVVKVSSNRIAMEREWENYQRVKNGFTRGLIVSPIEFLNEAGSNTLLAQKCALVMERGVHGDVKEFLARMGGKGLKGPALHHAARAAAKCIQIMHTSQLVWTDLKIENFVVVKFGEGSILIKAIDLESAIERGGTPVDFSPESCPPEFAAAFLAGEGQGFVLDYSYDIWSLGTFLYEVSTGHGPFEGLTPSEITHRLPNFELDIDDFNIDEPDLIDLITQCLHLNPEKRPSITQVLDHPFFSLN
uniref:Protein kinase domain-containing protein n=1 Tax=Odontella aurita TaxID=265563 RepID=A0A7S4HTP8_9STRA|mmetsp:Transcript_14905/g.43437  ORF Transcript_14905/g.43437 Transcript_14905/m.43437 type:complete len:539 (+) Transcript_14905:169-1785(+)